MNKKLCTLIFVFLFLNMLIGAQDRAVQIASIKYEIDGRTNPALLQKKANFPEGRVFDSISEYEKAITKLRLILLNERVLKEVEISSTFEETEAGEPLAAHVIVRVKDTWNIIALPYFKVDSNEGLLLSVRGRDYNFAGSMQPLELDFNYLNSTDEFRWGTELLFELLFSLPLSFMGLDWELLSHAALTYFSTGLSPYAGLALSLGSSVPLAGGELGFSLYNSFFVNPRDPDNVNYADPLYFRSELEANWNYAIAELGGEELHFVPGFKTGLNWSNKALTDEELNLGFDLSPMAKLSWGRVFWAENLRYGQEAELSASLSYWPAPKKLERLLSLEGSLFRAYDWFGFSAKAQFFYSMDKPIDRAGQSLRGILNNRAVTDMAMTVNLDLPLRLIRFLPSSWFKKDWMRVFDFEQYWSLFLDISQGHYNDSWFSLSDGWYSCGLELITWPLFMRSFFIRLSLGWDLAALVQTGDIKAKSLRDGQSVFELFLGMELQY